MFETRLRLLTITLLLAAVPSQVLAADDSEEAEKKEAVESPWARNKKAEAQKGAAEEAERKVAEEAEKRAAKEAEEKTAEEAAEAEAEGEEPTPPRTPEDEARQVAPSPTPKVETTRTPKAWRRWRREAEKPTKGGGALGLGFAVGTINGLSLKVWPHPVHGLVLHVGVPNLLNSVAASLSYRAHPKPILIPESPVSLHINLGPLVRVRAAFAAAAYVELAGGLAVGVSITVDDVPAEIFFEVAPLFAGSITALGTGLGFGIDGVVGARFYF
jgi:hypothetical protein